MAKKYFSVDARTLVRLGRESIREHTTAVLELVKNSYDADATEVNISIKASADVPLGEREIVIADNGHGMTEADIDDNWLRIGFSRKRTKSLTRRRRRQTGEKGVGRLSTDRLGSSLELTTRAKGHPAVKLEVNWDRFDQERKDLQSIPLMLSAAPPQTPAGTTLVVRNLREKWTAADVANLREELSILTPPLRKPDDFSITLKADVAPELDGIVHSPFLDVAEVRLSLTLAADGTAEYTVKSRLGKALKRRIRWEELTHSRRGAVGGPSLTGPVIIDLLFFPRKPELVLGTKFSLADLREFLDRNAGIRIYRDNVRVKPYGDPGSAEGDWLGLGPRKMKEPAGAARSTFKIAPTQLVGAVYVTRDLNPGIVDSSGREGLIENDALSALKAFVNGCVVLLESHYHQAFVATELSKPTVPAAATVVTLKRELKTLASGLRSARADMDATATVRSVEKSLDEIDSVIRTITDAERSLDELASQATIYRSLATVGITASIFGHETETAIGAFAGASETALKLLRVSPPRLDDAIEELTKAVNAGRRVAAWGSFALKRVSRDKRRISTKPIADVIRRLARELKPVFDSCGIMLGEELGDVRARYYAMDVESIVLNLLTNAYHAVQQVKRARRIRVELSAEKRNGVAGFAIVVADSGPGVPPEYMDRIWEPLFSTRMNDSGQQTGTGLGLSIVQSIIEELKGARDVAKDLQLRGARFTVWLPG